MNKIKTFILKHFEGSLIILIFLGILAIAFLVHYKFSFLNFFFLPVILSGYFLGKKHGVLTGTFCVLLVVLYLVFTKLFSGLQEGFSPDEVITLVSWGSFLVLTGGVVGMVSEQRENQVKKLRRAYTGVLEVLFKYLEVADETQPKSVRVASLAGKIAEEAGLDKREVENVKSASLLYDAGVLKSNIPLFVSVANFMGEELKLSGVSLEDREKVMIKTTASLLNEIKPLLTHYSHHYVEQADMVDKNLEEIPVGAGIIALADVYDRISQQPVSSGEGKIKSISDIENLSGRSYHVQAVKALRQLISG
ncbi:hypothetical protein KGY73_09460 [bacterium]|nr:hypothetical protein [bacterium]